MSLLRKRTSIPLLIAVAVIAALGVALYLRAKAPPEAARLLPESDAIVYVHLKTVRELTHFDATPVTRSPDFQHFIDATGIVPERDLDSVAFALHRMPDPRGPNGPVAYSEVFVGRFDGQRLNTYLASISALQETYAGHTIYTIPIDSRSLRVAQLGYDTIAASNMPTAEQIHSMLDRSRASALGTAGCSLLAAHFQQVPLLAQAWGIGHIGLPFSQHGFISLFGLQLPLPEDTDLVASLRFTTSAHLRIEEFAPNDAAAQNTADALNVLLNILRGLASAEPPHNAADAALRAIINSTSIEHSDSHAILSATATVDQLKALSTSHDPAAQPTPPDGAPKSPAK
jgi:hypothetical protein